MNRFKVFFPYIFIVIFGLVLFVIPFGNCDEIWNYNFAKCITEGMRPYKDFNIVQTPGSAYVSALFLLVFGKELISYRIASYVLFIFTFWIFYKLNKKTSKNDTISFVATMFLMCLCTLVWIYNYNNLSMMIILYLQYFMYTEKKSKKKDYIIAIVFGIFPFLKQNTGLFLMIAHFIICICDKFIYEENVKYVIKRVFISGIPMIIYVTWLLVIGDFKYFFEYAVIGIRYFTHRESYIDFITISGLTFFFFLISLFMLIKCIVKMIKQKELRINHGILLTSIAWLSLTYPLCDINHFLISIMPLIPCFFMCTKIKELKLLEKAFCYTYTIIIAIFFFYVRIPNDEHLICEINHYNNIPMIKTLNETIIEVDEYILEQEKNGYDVYIADDTSATYMIPLDRYRKNWDMLLLGNIGCTTVDDLLTNDENRIYLVFRNDKAIGYQGHFELISKIKNEYEKIDEVAHFDVYKEKNK